MALAELSLKKHYLMPSALIVSAQPMEVTTILGSCVAVCLYDPVSQIGGINHYMLDLWNGNGLESPKYGDIAIDLLIEKMIHSGAGSKRIIAKIFGGAASLKSSVNSFTIGERNIVLAEKKLSENGIPIKARHTGGHQGRNIRFYTHTGEIHMRMVKKSI